jgi:hypothetical protein
MQKPRTGCMSEEEVGKGRVHGLQGRSEEEVLIERERALCGPFAISL